MLGRMRGLERFPMPFYRHALAELAATRSRDLGTLAQTDAAFGARTLATYTGLYDTLLRQAQDQFIGDAREQAFFQYKIDNNLHAQTELYAAMPRSQAEIADSTFRLAQLRSFGRLTLATLSAELDRSGVDPAAHGQAPCAAPSRDRTAPEIRRPPAPTRARRRAARTPPRTALRACRRGWSGSGGRCVGRR
jgi:hypothetical protein